MEDNFYSSMPAIKDFNRIFEDTLYAPVPEDWFVVMTDIVGSTQAIHKGLYKQVNAAGSLSAMAISNVLGNMNFPFFFGGDGMTMLVPASLVSTVKPILSGTIRLVESLFDLKLRASVIPVKELSRRGHNLFIAKLAVSEKYNQAIINGTGFDEADRMMKDDSSIFKIHPEDFPDAQPDYTGYTCRWQDYPSAQDETVALIVKFIHTDTVQREEIFHTVLELVGTAEEHHPLRAEKSKLVWKKEKTNPEAQIFSGHKTGIRPLLYRIKIRMESGLALLFIKFGIRFFIGKKDISKSKIDNVSSSDYRKFDSTLKMIVAMKTDDRRKLEEYLAGKYNEGAVLYGLHTTDKATITCLLHAGSGNEVHFVDAADGGYAFAALQIKEQMKKL